MINLSLPASEVMATDVPIIHRDDGLDYVKQLVTNSRYRTACIVDEEGKLLGMISRNTFVYDIHKSVILLDHNEYSQAVDGIEHAEILEIIDHHRLGTMTTLKPIKFIMEPVGSTSTIIASIYQESKKRHSADNSRPPPCGHSLRYPQPEDVDNHSKRQRYGCLSFRNNRD